MDPETPRAAGGSGIFSTPPYPHQLRGMEWMSLREKTPTRGCVGGLLMDEPGLGKTYQMWGLIYANPIPAGKTLLVAPAHLIAMWLEQSALHFTDAARASLRVRVYYGKRRLGPDGDPAGDPTGGEIWITSYSIVARLWQAWKKSLASPGDRAMADRESVFFGRTWSRIVLDEAHVIRNAKTKLSCAIRALRGERHWAITATPVVNHMDDLFAIFNFLQVRPYGGRQGKRIWNNFLRTTCRKDTAPVKHIVSAIGLNRTKSAELSMRNASAHKLGLRMSGFQKRFYDALYDYSRRKTERLLRRVDDLRRRPPCAESTSARINRHLSCALTHILRLKQAASCPLLAIRKMHMFRDAIRDLCAERASVRDTQHRILLRLREAGQCPSDSEPCDSGTSGTASSEHLRAAFGESCKSAELIRLLRQKLAPASPPNKVVVISQWQGFLDILQKDVADAEPTWRHVSITGSSGNAETRQKLVHRFQTDPSVRILYMTLAAGGVGLTLTAASDLIFTDLWWNPATHYQAENRVHRIGQSQDVEITTMFVSHTIEDNILRLLDHKAHVALGMNGANQAAPDPRLPGECMRRIRCCLDLEEPLSLAGPR